MSSSAVSCGDSFCFEHDYARVHLRYLFIFLVLLQRESDTCCFYYVLGEDTLVNLQIYETEYKYNHIPTIS